MGHSENINMNVYVVPMAESEVRTVGIRLQEMDGQMPRLAVRSAVFTDTISISRAEPTDYDVQLDYSKTVTVQP